LAPETLRPRVSVLFNESKLPKSGRGEGKECTLPVSVLFNESKLPKCCRSHPVGDVHSGFSTLQRVEIAEIEPRGVASRAWGQFQYSSTSRNCRN